MPRRSPRLLELANAQRKNKRKANVEPIVRSYTDAGYLPRRSQRVKDQKKKALKTYIRQVPTVLDNLPLHIIAHHIFPYLDYHSRINLNICLPAWDRVTKKMNPASVKKHETNVCVARVSSILGSLMETQTTSHYYPSLWIYRGDKRIQRMIHMLGLFLKDEYFFIYTHFPTFRDVFSAKIDEMWNLANAQGPQELYSRVWLDELVSTCNALRNKILINQSAMVDDYRTSIIPSLSFT
jgi:hypothetical protein